MRVTIEFDPTNAEDVKGAGAAVAKFDVSTTTACNDGGCLLLLGRIGESAAEFLALAKKHTKAGEDFTFESLAAKSKVPAGTLKAWHRNLGRTMNNLGEKAPTLFTEKWDGQRQHYTLTDQARAAL